MKRIPAWLVELHRQWHASRGNLLVSRSRDFSREWAKLLDAAGIRSAEDIKTAEREAEELEKAGRIKLGRNRYRRYLIEKIVLSLGEEAWLRELMGGPDPESLRLASIAAVEDAERKVHPKFPEDWSRWLKALRQSFEAGKQAKPLHWRHPGVVSRMLEIVYGLSSREWKDDIDVREASVALGLHSKGLERSKRLCESCLEAMFGKGMSLSKLGVGDGAPRIEIAGELTLRFPDGRSQTVSELRGSYHVSADLLGATSASTPAKRILLIENTKSTLRRLSSLNESRDTLMLAGAYPSRGLRRLMEILPRDLPVFHFGDTDPAGFLILAKHRRCLGRPVRVFMMERRVGRFPITLTGFDRGILPGLIEDPMLEDVRPALLAISSSGDKGDYEQESLGIPDLAGWPFYRVYDERL